MHVATKDSSQDGKTHLLTTVIEADGAFEICAESDILSGEVISVKRTASGGIEAVSAIRISNAAIEAQKVIDATAHVESRGYSPEAAASIVAEHGPDVILADKADAETETEPEAETQAQPSSDAPEL